MIGTSEPQWQKVRVSILPIFQYFIGQPTKNITVVCTGLLGKDVQPGRCGLYQEGLKGSSHCRTGYADFNTRWCMPCPSSNQLSHRWHGSTLQTYDPKSAGLNHTNISHTRTHAHTHTHTTIRTKRTTQSSINNKNSHIKEDTTYQKGRHLVRIFRS